MEDDSFGKRETPAPAADRHWRAGRSGPRRARRPAGQTRFHLGLSGRSGPFAPPFAVSDHEASVANSTRGLARHSMAYMTLTVTVTSSDPLSIGVEVSAARAASGAGAAANTGCTPPLSLIDIGLP